MESDGRTKAYKFVAYAAVSFSVVAVLSVVLTLPMVYNYVSHVRRQMQHEISFCKGSAKDIFAEVNFMKSNAGPAAPRNRTSRQSGYGGPEIALNSLVKHAMSDTIFGFNKSHVIMAAGLAGAAFIGYCIYFDHARRSAPDYKEKIRRSEFFKHFYSPYIFIDYIKILGTTNGRD
ncbi:nematode cuticle collagen domain protein [Oesophagostomum dentatum]|uniref:Nematode cuticle collagen domain protein n=1 Tax=Oesophagostomum dentatum TaxID=61180 RepID=A0A0B1SXJ8_OESDE|nr:nematode cuticle collagen domain protein [Oesophagostomum dentatum]